MNSGLRAAPSGLITGVAGFIGSHLAERLLGTGHNVIGLDNFDSYYPAAIKRDNLVGAHRSKNFTLIEGDVRDASLLKDILRQGTVQQVFHLAAKVGVRDSGSNAREYMHVNVHGTECLLGVMAEFEVKHLVLASSSSVYGASEELPFCEDGPVEPTNPYGHSKLLAEDLCREFSRGDGIRSVICRLFTAYGPRQRPDMGMSRFVRSVLQEDPVQLYNYETSRRDYTHVFDVVSGLMLAGLAMKSRAESYTLNIGSGVSWSLPEILRIIATNLNSEPTLELKEAEVEEMRETLADISRARALGYSPAWTIEKGIAEYIRWVRSHKHLLHGRSGDDMLHSDS